MKLFKRITQSLIFGVVGGFCIGLMTVFNMAAMITFGAVLAFLWFYNDAERFSHR